MLMFMLMVLHRRSEPALMALTGKHLTPHPPPPPPPPTTQHLVPHSPGHPGNCPPSPVCIMPSLVRKHCSVTPLSPLLSPFPPPSPSQARQLPGLIPVLGPRLRLQSQNTGAMGSGQHAKPLDSFLTVFRVSPPGA